MSRGSSRSSSRSSSRGSSCGLSRDSSSTTSPTPRVRVPRHVARLVMWLVVNYFDYAVCPGASACRAAHHAARHRLLRLRRASGCLGTSRGSSRDSSRRSSSTTSPTPRVRVPRHVARLVVDYLAASRGSSCGSSRHSSSTTSPPPCVRVPRHVARLVTWLVVDYFDYAARPGASAHRAARHPARRRLLLLRRASGCFGTSRGLSRDSSLNTPPRAGSSSTTPPRAGSSPTTSSTPRIRVPRHVARLVVDYFNYTARPGVAARCAARRRLLRLRRASGCLGTSCGSSRGSPVPLVVDYFTYAARPGASARRATRYAACRQLLRLRHASVCLSTSRGSSCGSPRRSSSTTSPTPCVRMPRLVVDYFAYAARPGASARRAARR
jgi:hypothetical protein